MRPVSYSPCSLASRFILQYITLVAQEELPVAQLASPLAYFISPENFPMGAVWEQRNENERFAKEGPCIRILYINISIIVPVNIQPKKEEVVKKRILCICDTIESNLDLSRRTHANVQEKRATRSKDENAVENEGGKLCNPSE